MFALCMSDVRPVHSQPYLWCWLCLCHDVFDWLLTVCFRFSACCGKYVLFSSNPTLMFSSLACSDACFHFSCYPSRTGGHKNCPDSWGMTTAHVMYHTICLFLYILSYDRCPDCIQNHDYSTYLLCCFFDVILSRNRVVVNVFSP